MVARTLKKVQAISPADSINTDGSLQQVARETREANVPPSGGSCDASVIRALSRDFGTEGLKMLGILLICFAIDLGAPFWSDMLSKFINLRSPGDPPIRAAS